MKKLVVMLVMAVIITASVFGLDFSEKTDSQLIQMIVEIDNQINEVAMLELTTENLIKLQKLTCERTDIELELIRRRFPETCSY